MVRLVDHNACVGEARCFASGKPGSLDEGPLYFQELVTCRLPHTRSSGSLAPAPSAFDKGLAHFPLSPSSVNFGAGPYITGAASDQSHPQVGIVTLG